MAATRTMRMFVVWALTLEQVPALPSNYTGMFDLQVARPLLILADVASLVIESQGINKKMHVQKT